MSYWLEEALASMPAQGRLLLRGPQELAFGFTDDRKTEKGNQDRAAIAYCLDPSQFGDPWFFAGVCDGVGGEPKGEIAASIALSEVLSELCAGNDGLSRGRLFDAINRAHAAVRERLRGSATTFAGVLVSAKGTFSIGTVGDSRIYSVSQEEVVKLSQDDTLEDMLRRQAPHANDPQLTEVLQGLQQRWKDSLGQAIGSEMPLEPRCSSWPHIAKDVGCLLCTDGVWKTVEPVLKRVVVASRDRQDLARRLLTLTDTLSADDNATAIVIPNLARVLAWLRSRHSPSESGLVHIVLPTGEITAPWTDFDKRVVPVKPMQRPAEEPASQSPGQPAKTKSKRKSKTPKSLEHEKDPGVQLTIEEEVRDEQADAPSAVPKDQQGTS